MVVQRRDATGRVTVWCDPEIADLVDALNTHKLGTVASCSGHGFRPGSIVMRDGRVLMIFKSLEHARAAERAYPLDINGAPMTELLGDEVGARPMPNPYDICQCGDYRRDHEGGTGASKFPADRVAGHVPCARFRLQVRSRAGQPEDHHDQG